MLLLLLLLLLFSWLGGPSGPRVTLSGPTITLRHTTLRGIPLDKSDRPLMFGNTQHSSETCIHAPGEIRIRNPSYRASVDRSLSPAVISIFTLHIIYRQLHR